MANELKPCPFCGGKAELAWDGMDGLAIRVDHGGGCPIGGMRVIQYCYSNAGHLGFMEEAAADFWNRRADG